MKTLVRLSRLILPLFPVMALAVLFGTAGFLCAIAIPVTGIMALTSSLPFKMLVIVGVARGVLHYAEQYCNHFIAFTLLARIRNIVFKKLRELGPGKLAGAKKGNLISILTSDIELLELFYAHTVSPVCIAILVSAVCVAFLAHFNAVLSAVAFVFYLFVGGVIPFVIQRTAVKSGIVHRERFSEMNSFLLDTLRGLQQTILFNNGKKRHEKLLEKNASLLKSQKSLALHEGATAAFIEGSVFVCDILMLCASVFLYRSGKIDFNSSLIATATLASSFGPVIAVARLGSSLSQTVASGKRVLSLLDEKPIVKTVVDGENLAEFGGASFENVDFAYDSEKILTNLSLEFPKNQIIGLEGKSGSGKSTVLRLLMRFWDASSGTVKISNAAIQKINTHSLRTLESYVTQETVLFHDTIENNIKIARLDATHAEIVEACKKAAIHDFIESLPNAYDTQIAELGENFSGGERQRLGLARAFLHGSEFLLLDEPTSNLDSYNEKIILDSVKKEAGRKTVVLVSHRESTLKVCDKIHKISNGRNS